MTLRDDAPGEPSRDEHLLAALRHAPDHALTPPSHVTQAILAAAEQVHRAPAPAVAEPAAERTRPVRHVSLAERLQALLAPRWAGSVAAGLVAALVVGLWYEEELPSPVNSGRVAEQTQSDDRPAAPAQSPVTPARVESEAPTPKPHQAASPAQIATDRPAELRSKAATAPRSETAVQPAKPDPAAPKVDAASPPAAAPAAKAPTTTEAGVLALRDARTTEADATPPAGAAAPPTADPPRRAEPGLAAGSTSARSANAEAVSVGVMRLAPSPATSAVGVAAASPALTLLRRARADIDARNAIWTWQPASGTTARSFDADAQAWLQRLVYAARGRWIDVAEPSDGGAATELRWWRNDEPVATLRIEARGLRWTEPSSRIRYAPMTADELTRLRPP